MTTNPNAEDQDAQAPGNGITAPNDHEESAPDRPDSKGGTGSDSNDAHQDDPVTGVGPEDPS